MASKKLIGKTVRITSDNENYEDYVGKDLIITSASNEGMGYDDSMYPEMLVDLKVADTEEEVPFALYEYEFKIVAPSKKKSNRNERKIKKLQAIVDSDKVSDQVKEKAKMEIEKLSTSVKKSVKPKGLKSLLKDEPKNTDMPDTDKLLEKMKAKKATRKKKVVNVKKSGWGDLVIVTPERTKAAKEWWSSLSTNEQKKFVKKHLPENWPSDLVYTKDGKQLIVMWENEVGSDSGKLLEKMKAKRKTRKRPAKKK